MHNHTAAIEALVSSPGAACVTSAPKMIVGRSVKRGIFLWMASNRTVFLPPAFTCEYCDFNAWQNTEILTEDYPLHTNLHINFQRHILKILRAKFWRLLRLTTLRHYTKLRITHCFYFCCTRKEVTVSMKQWRKHWTKRTMTHHKNHWHQATLLSTSVVAVAAFRLGSRHPKVLSRSEQGEPSV